MSEGLEHCSIFKIRAILGPSYLAHRTSHIARHPTMTQLTIFGATGFTGRITAAYIAKHAEREGLTWAIAGRSEAALIELRESLVGVKPDVVVADIRDKDSLRAMTASTKVLMNAVGPFAMYGPDVVAACLESGTHYLDITGEPEFLNLCFVRHHQAAMDKGIAIVNACGFDSIPADFATWLAVKELPVEVPKSVRCYVSTNATFSGGTLNTAVQSVLNKRTGKRQDVVTYPKHPDAPKIDRGIQFSTFFGKWALPMPVADIHIVRRSAMRLPDEYGPAFSYAQFFLARSFGAMVSLLSRVIVLFTFIRFAWFRDWIYKKYSPGTGPSPEKRASSHFTVTAIAETIEGQTSTVEISGGDPGYDETAKFFAESAFCLLEKEREGSLKYGVLTPVEAMGEELVKRLEKEGIGVSRK